MLIKENFLQSVKTLHDLAERLQKISAQKPELPAFSMANLPIFKDEELGNPSESTICSQVKRYLSKYYDNFAPIHQIFFVSVVSLLRQSLKNRWLQYDEEWGQDWLSSLNELITDLFLLSDANRKLLESIEITIIRKRKLDESFLELPSPEHAGPWLRAHRDSEGSLTAESASCSSPETVGEGLSENGSPLHSLVSKEPSIATLKALAEERLFYDFDQFFDFLQVGFLEKVMTLYQLVRLYEKMMETLSIPPDFSRKDIALFNAFDLVRKAISGKDDLLFLSGRFEDPETQDRVKKMKNDITQFFSSFDVTPNSAELHIRERYMRASGAFYQVRNDFLDALMLLLKSYLRHRSALSKENESFMTALNDLIRQMLPPEIFQKIKALEEVRVREEDNILKQVGELIPYIMGTRKKPCSFSEAQCRQIEQARRDIACEERQMEEQLDKLIKPMKGVSMPAALGLSEMSAYVQERLSAEIEAEADFMKRLKKKPLSLPANKLRDQVLFLYRVASIAAGLSVYSEDERNRVSLDQFYVLQVLGLTAGLNSDEEGKSLAYRIRQRKDSTLLQRQLKNDFLSLLKACLKNKVFEVEDIDRPGDLQTLNQWFQKMLSLSVSNLQDLQQLERDILTPQRRLLHMADAADIAWKQLERFIDHYKDPYEIIVQHIKTLCETVLLPKGVFVYPRGKELDALCKEVNTRLRSEDCSKSDLQAIVREVMQPFFDSCLPASRPPLRK